MKILPLLVGLVVSISCNLQKESRFCEIINDTFLQMTDTFAYRYHSFFLIPGDSMSKDKKSQPLKVCYNENLISSTRYIGYLIPALKGLHEEEYLKLLGKKYVSSVMKLPPLCITNKGKYDLISHADTDCNKLDSTYIGSIQFAEPVMNDNIAVIFMRIISDQKAGKVTAFLVQKSTDRWTIVKEIVLERN